MTQELAIRDEAHYLATVDEVKALALRIEHVGDAKALADKARAAQVWAERARLGADQVNLAAIAKVWAERRAGELLREAPKNTGAAGIGTSAVASNDSTTPTLADIGVTRDQSSRWQKLAEIPQPEFEEAIEEAAQEGRVSTAAVQRHAEHKRLTALAKEHLFPAPTPAFDAFFKASSLLLQKALPAAAADENLDADDRQRVIQHAEVMTERIAELAAIARGTTLRVVQGGSRADH